MARKLIPFGDRIIVRRIAIGAKLGSGILVAAEQTADRPTDVCEVIHVPDNTFADKELIGNAEEIIKNQMEKVKSGDAYALNSIQGFNSYLRNKMIQPGMRVFVRKYTGIDFEDKENPGRVLTMCDLTDVVGMVINYED